MTTVVITTNAFYSDKRYNSDGFIEDNAVKLRVYEVDFYHQFIGLIKEKVAVAFLGDFDVIDTFEKWLFVDKLNINLLPEKLKDENTNYLIVICINNVIKIIDSVSVRLTPITLPLNGYAAYGSGGYYAQGALMMGVTPIEAIKLAAKNDKYTNDSVDKLCLKTFEFTTH